jgi:hypothetical protein
MQHSKRLRWNLFAAKSANGQTRIAASPSSFGAAAHIVRASVTVDSLGTWIGRLDPAGGAPDDLRPFLAGTGGPDADSLRFRVEFRGGVGDDVGRTPGDPAAGSLRWTVHPGALADRTCQLLAAVDPFITAETAWYLASSADTYVRATVALNVGAPAELLEWYVSADRANAAIAGRTLARIHAGLPALEAARLRGDDAKLAVNLCTPTKVLDGLARFGSPDVRARAMTNPAVPIRAVAASLRSGDLRVRVIAARRFSQIEGNPRWSGFSRRAIVAAVEWDLDDDVADAVRDMTEAECADNFGDWADMPLSRR